VNSNKYYVALIVGALFGSLPPVRAEVVEAEGVASIRPAGIDHARQAAIQDAMNQASLLSGVEIETSNAIGARGVQLESSRVRSAAIIGKATVLREWQSGDYLHVHISVDVARSGDIAGANQKYKKKIAATSLSIQKSYVTDDVEDLSGGFANELLRRLESGNKFLTKKSQYAISHASGPSQDTGDVIHIATMYDSQFVISGEILDAGTMNEGGYFGLFQHKRRRFEVEIYVYDGLTGSLVGRHRIEKSAVGDVAIGRDKPFASASFFATSFGKAISEALDTASELIAKDLENLPFAARVIKIADGRIYIDAGGTSFVAPGDKLVAYHLRREFPLSGFGPGNEYGITETPVTTVSIVQVQPLFSICTLPTSAKGVTLEVGDLVRFDFINQVLDTKGPSLF